MILEALEYLTTPCPPWARRFGYLSESIAIRHRARRCRAAWEPHLAATRDAILRHTPSGVGEIVVLGAGLCHDIPLAMLADRCRRLTLVDAVRPRFGPRLPPNARYLAMDVHGAAVALHDGRDPWPRGPSPLKTFADADIVLSVNLLSQLPLLPLRVMRRRGLLETPRDAVEAERRILRDHVADLREMRGRVVLIADARRTRRDTLGHSETDRPADDAALGPPLESWVWPVAPPGEAADGSRLETTVGVWVLG